MKKILLKEDEKTTIRFEHVSYDDVPIFIKKDDKLVGMVVKDNNGWILKFGGNNASAWQASLDKLLNNASRDGYTFHI